MFSLREIRRFLSRYVVLENGCWEWHHSKNYKGYGKFWYPGGASAHKFSYLLNIGPVPDGLVLDHICRKRDCVNPGHLRPITAAMNTLIGDGMGARHARQTHCKNGHPFSSENTRVYKLRNGRKVRACRICKLEYKRAHNKKNAEKIKFANRERWRKKYSKYPEKYKARQGACA